MQLRFTTMSKLQYSQNNLKQENIISFNFLLLSFSFYFKFLSIYTLLRPITRNDLYVYKLRFDFFQ